MGHWVLVNQKPSCPMNVYKAKFSGIYSRFSFIFNAQLNIK